MTENGAHPNPNRKRRPRTVDRASAGLAAGGETTPRRTSGPGVEMGTSGHRYRLLFEQNLAGVYLTTLAGTILNCNKSMAAMLGYDSREELLNHRAHSLYFSPTDREEFLSRLLKTGALNNDERVLRCKNGAAVYILENVQLVPDENGDLSLIQGTMVDITELKRAQAALQASEQRHRGLADELRSLMRRLHTIREEERTRIAREIHDELGQALTVLNMDLHWLRGRAARDCQDARNRIDSMCKLVGTTILAVHRICADLRPTILDDFGLSAAIEWQAREFQSRTDIRCHLSLPSDSPDLLDEQTTAVFRIFQECLTNVARHAHARLVNVTLEITPEVLILEVVDDGAGIPEEAISGRGSFGIAGMRERALQWGGQVTIARAGNNGTRVVLRMPVKNSPMESVP